MFDLIIIGAGPAGMTAGIYAARRELKTLIIGKNLGGQVVWGSEIENYPGFKSIKSYELVNRMQEQVKNLGVDIKIEGVKNIEKKDEVFTTNTEKDSYQSKSVIIATGLTPRRLELEEEAKFTGRGVSYCANCDAPFYKNKTVAVVGGGNSALDAAEILSKIAQKVYLIHRRDSFRAFDALVSEVQERDNIEIITDSQIKKLEGDTKLERIKIANTQNQEERSLEVDGLFIEIGRVAQTNWLSDLVNTDENDQIKVNRRTETKTPGLFAAGDVTDNEFKQITVACGQATTAALASYQYIQKLPKN